jgi:hypothetical protein
MCISASASLNAFLFNLISAISLVYFGNNELKPLNLIVALFSVFTSFMQLIDLGIWLDLGCDKGYNKTASIIGPIINFLQPIMPFVIAFFVLNYTKDGIEYRKNKLIPLESSSKLFDMFSISSKKLNLVKILNIIATILIILVLISYFVKNQHNLCSKLKDGYVAWGWLQHRGLEITLLGIIYMTITFMNLGLIDPISKYMKIVIVLYLVILLISYLISKKYKGELWCLVSNCMPLMLLIIQKLFKRELSR